MGCNCKKTLNDLEKYSDDYDENQKLSEKNIITKIIEFFLKLGMGILVGCISIVILPFVVIWLVICIIFQKSPSLNLKRINKNKSLKHSNGK